MCRCLSCRPQIAFRCILVTINQSIILTVLLKNSLFLQRRVGLHTDPKYNCTDALWHDRAFTHQEWVFKKKNVLITEKEKFCWPSFFWIRSHTCTGCHRCLFTSCVWPVFQADVSRRAFADKFDKAVPPQPTAAHLRFACVRSPCRTQWHPFRSLQIRGLLRCGTWSICSEGSSVIRTYFFYPWHGNFTIIIIIIPQPV